MLFAVVAGLLVSLGSGAAPAHADNPPVLTESFETVSGLPAGWKLFEWKPGASTAAIVSGAAADGTHFLQIVSRQLNHAGVAVPVQVTPNTSYQFHAMAKATGVNEHAAAVLGVDGQITATNSVRTDVQWQPLDLYIKVGSQTTIKLIMGLGHYSQLNVGTADFDAVTVSQVSTIPDKATVVDLAAPPAGAGKPQSAAESTSTPGPNRAIWAFVVILVVVGIGAAAFLMRRGGTASTPDGPPESS